MCTAERDNPAAARTNVVSESDRKAEDEKQHERRAIDDVTPIELGYWTREKRADAQSHNIQTYAQDGDFASDVEAFLYAFYGEHCLGKGRGDIRAGRACGGNPQSVAESGSVLRMKRMSQSVQKPRSLPLRASDGAEKGAEDRPRAPAGLHSVSPGRGHTNHLSIRSSGFGRPSLGSGGRAFTGRRMLERRTRRGVCGGEERVFMR
jgi:hypothetical protein